MNIRRQVGNALFGIKERLGLYRLAEAKGSLAVLMYHGLEANESKRQSRPLDVHPKYCLDEIQFFVKQGYQLVSPENLESSPKDANYLIVSFDDGHLNIAPYLSEWMSRHQIPVTLAVCPNVIENQSSFWWEEVSARYSLSKELSQNEADAHLTELGAMPNEQRLSALDKLRSQTGDVSAEQISDSDYVHRNMDWSQLNELAQNPLCTIASHSLGHEMATRLSADELLKNARNSKMILEQQCQQAVNDFVYPNGDCSDATDQIIAEAGYQRFYGLGDVINGAAGGEGRLNRIRGYGKGSDNLRYYAHVWQRRHSRIGAAPEEGGY